MDMDVIPFAEAKRFTMPFGKHSGRTVDEIAQSDEGLLYLDYLRGQMDLDPPHFGAGRETHVALTAYLDDPTISRELGELL